MVGVCDQAAGEVNGLSHRVAFVRGEQNLGLGVLEEQKEVNEDTLIIPSSGDADRPNGRAPLIQVVGAAAAASIETLEATYAPENEDQSDSDVDQIE